MVHYYSELVILPDLGIVLLLDLGVLLLLDLGIALLPHLRVVPDLGVVLLPDLGVLLVPDPEIVMTTQEAVMQLNSMSVLVPFSGLEVGQEKPGSFWKTESDKNLILFISTETMNFPLTLNKKIISMTFLRLFHKYQLN